MDYKEKYEKAVQAAMLAKQDTESAVTVQALEEIFPELRESEDERIKKEITELVMLPTWKTEAEFHRRKELVAWLEKQVEHSKFRDSIQVGDKVTRNQDGVLVNLSQLNRVAKKQCEQSPAKNKGMDLVEEEMTPFQKEVFCIIDTTIEEEQGLKQVCDKLFALASNEIEQKPAWSEEDEERLSDAIFFVREYQIPTRDKWLLNAAKEAEDWLKSLRPQKQWKPSEEQMGVIAQSIAVLKVSGYGELGDRLGDISEQLNKLKG